MLLTGYGSPKGQGWGNHSPTPVLKRPPTSTSPSTSTPSAGPSGSVPEFDGASIVAVAALVVAVIFIVKSRISSSTRV